MSERQKRLLEVYEYVHNYFNIHTKGDFADKIGYARAYISSALNGNEKYLTDKLFNNISSAFPGVFNLIYLIEGKGELTTLGEQCRVEHVELEAIKQTSAQSPDAGFYKSVIDSHIQHIADLRKSNERLESMVYDLGSTIQDLREEKEQLIAEVSSLNAHVEHYKHLVDVEKRNTEQVKVTLDEVRINLSNQLSKVEEQKRIITTLQAELKARRDNPLYDYPHPIGVAEVNTQTSLATDGDTHQ